MLYKSANRRGILELTAGRRALARFPEIGLSETG